MDFFQALRLLENAHPDKPRIGASLRPRDDAVRFGRDPSLGFEPGAVAGFTPAMGDAKARLAVNFFGFVLWLYSTLCMNLALGYFPPSSALEWTIIAFAGWALYRTGLKSELVSA